MGDPRAEAWVRTKGLDVLTGKAGIVAASIKRKATCLHLDKQRRRKADQCATYLKNKRRCYLDYPTALDCGWPIATGVIEGMPPSRARPLRHHRCPLVPRRSGGSTETTCSPSER